MSVSSTEGPMEWNPTQINTEKSKMVRTEKGNLWVPSWGNQELEKVD